MTNGMGILAIKKPLQFRYKRKIIKDPVKN
jgi:hypothetical protein